MTMQQSASRIADFASAANSTASPKTWRAPGIAIGSYAVTRAPFSFRRWITRIEAASRMSSVSFLKARPRTATRLSSKEPMSFSESSTTLAACRSFVFRTDHEFVRTERVVDRRALLQEFRVRAQTQFDPDPLPAARFEQRHDDGPRRPRDDGALHDHEPKVSLGSKGGPDLAGRGFHVACVNRSV